MNCVLPAIQGLTVLVPPSQIPWLLSQPEHVLNTKEVHRDSLEADYTMLNPEIVRHPVHEDVIRRDLTRQLGSLTMEIMEELGNGFDRYWGFDTENWKEACVYDNMMKIIARTSNRIIVGLPLCE